MEREMNNRGYVAEAALMRLLAKNPDLTAWDVYYNPWTGELRLRTPEEKEG